MTEDNIRRNILQVCNIPSWDSDFNVLAFHAMCDKLKAIGAAEEREVCLKLCKENFYAHLAYEDIRARGNT